MLGSCPGFPPIWSDTAIAGDLMDSHRCWQLPGIPCDMKEWFRLYENYNSQLISNGKSILLFQWQLSDLCSCKDHLEIQKKEKTFSIQCNLLFPRVSWCVVSTYFPVAKKTSGSCSIKLHIHLVVYRKRGKLQYSFTFSFTCFVRWRKMLQNCYIHRNYIRMIRGIQFKKAFCQGVVLKYFSGIVNDMIRYSKEN